MKTISRVSSGVKGLIGSFGLPKCCRVQLRQVLEFAIEAPGEPWHRRCRVRRYLCRAIPLSTSTTSESCRSRPACPAHRDALEGDAFALDGLHEIHEGGRSHDRDGLALIAAEIHAAQSAPQRLFRQDVALGGVGAQADDDRHVAHVPAFLEHQHGDDRLVGRLPGVDFVRLLAQQLQFFLALARCRLGNLAVVLGVDHQHRALQFGADLFEIACPLHRSCWCRPPSRTARLSCRASHARRSSCAIPRCRAADSRRISR